MSTSDGVALVGQLIRIYPIAALVRQLIRIYRIASIGKYWIDGG